MSSHDFYLFSDETFWILWQEHQNYLYHCCVKWMGSFADAEDALSQAMFKAYEKIRNFSGNIKSFQAWLTQLTHNVCMDIHRKDYQQAKQVESWEFNEELASHEETPILLTIPKKN